MGNLVRAAKHLPPMEPEEIAGWVKRVMTDDPMPEKPDALPDAECGRCRGVGFLRPDVLPGHPDFGKLIDCTCPTAKARVARRAARIWESAKIPPKFARHTLASYVERTGNRALVADLEAWELTKRWAVMTGTVGVCKTGLSIALLRRALDRGEAGLYVVVSTMFARLQATYGERAAGDPGELDVLKTLTDADFLVLDDLAVGDKPLSAWAQERLWTVVNERDLQERRTIVTTNLPIDPAPEDASRSARFNRPRASLSALLWPQTWDRIRGRADVFELTGPSQRGLDDAEPIETEELPW